MIQKLGWTSAPATLEHKVKKAQFDAVFQERVIDTLAPLGFRTYGKSVALHDPVITVALVRLGGKLSSAGMISHILCFRHSMLREHSQAELTVPDGPPQSLHDYPFKFPYPSELRDEQLKSYRYTPGSDIRYEKLKWDDQPDAVLQDQLRSLAAIVGNVFLPWAYALTPVKAAEQIRRYGNNDWCEQRWLEDYDAFNV